MSKPRLVAPSAVRINRRSAKTLLSIWEDYAGYLHERFRIPSEDDEKAKRDLEKALAIRYRSA